MTSFGYKMGWFAIRNADKKSVLAPLGLTAIKEISWDEGIDFIYSDIKGGTVFITPPVKDWTFVVGRWAAGTGKEDGIPDIEELITKLSTQFCEVQAFATHRIIEYHHWMLAKNGRLIRSFAYIGERGEVLTNKGELTQIERHYKWKKLNKCLWSPNEETVMQVAAAWSINPTDIEELNLGENSGILASSPTITGNNRFIDIDSIDFDDIDSIDIEELIFDEDIEIKKPWWKFW